MITFPPVGKRSLFFPRACAGGLPPPLHPPPGGKAPGPPGRFAPVRHPGSIHESSWLDYNVFWTAVPPLGHGHVDHPSNQASVRPTVRRPGLPTYKTSIVLTATIFTLFKATTKVAACGRHHKRGGAAFGRATSFVVSFVLALNGVNIVAVATILVFHVGNGRSEHVRLDIMFRAVRASCSLAVRAMRACAQEGP